MRINIAVLVLLFVCSAVFGGSTSDKQIDTVPATIIEQFKLDTLAEETAAGSDEVLECEESEECLDCDGDCECDDCDHEEDPAECHGECH